MLSEKATLGALYINEYLEGSHQTPLFCRFWVISQESKRLENCQCCLRSCLHLHEEV